MEKLAATHAAQVLDVLSARLAFATPAINA
jgi:hypothetical protein